MIKKLIEWYLGKKIIGVFGEVGVRGDDGEWHMVLAKVDTGAYRTSLDLGLARKWGLANKGHLKRVKVSNVHGSEWREVYQVRLKIQGKLVDSELSLFDRSTMRYAMILGRLDLEKFLIIQNHEQSRKTRYWKGDRRKM